MPPAGIRRAFQRVRQPSVSLRMTIQRGKYDSASGGRPFSSEDTTPQRKDDRLLQKMPLLAPRTTFCQWINDVQMGALGRKWDFGLVLGQHHGLSPKRFNQPHRFCFFQRQEMRRFLSKQILESSGEGRRNGMSAQSFHRMKQTIISSLIGFALALLAPQIVQAQGTMAYLSSLDSTSAGSLAVGSNSWWGVYWGTGTNASGYTLDSIQLAMTDATGSPRNFTVMLFEGGEFITGLLMGTNIGTMDGSLSPTTAGLYTFTPASNITLLPRENYEIVLTAGTAVANGAYDWSNAGAYSYNESGGWFGSFSLASTDGINWNELLHDYPQYAITVTDVPEPGVLSLFGWGGVAFLWHRRKSNERQNRD